MVVKFAFGDNGDFQLLPAKYKSALSIRPTLASVCSCFQAALPRDKPSPHCPHFRSTQGIVYAALIPACIPVLGSMRSRLTGGGRKPDCHVYSQKAVPRAQCSLQSLQALWSLLSSQ